MTYTYQGMSRLRPCPVVRARPSACLGSPHRPPRRSRRYAGLDLPNEPAGEPNHPKTETRPGSDKRGEPLSVNTSIPDTERQPSPQPEPAPTRKAGRRRIAGLLTILLAIVATAVGASAPAYASTPQCTDQHGFHYTDINGDKLLGVGPGFIDYKAWAPAARYSDGSFRWSCLMGRGAHGTAVYELQSAINSCYGSQIQPGGIKLGLHLVEDGDFGPATKAALIKIQQRHKITADGVYGPQTALAMRHDAWAYSGDIGTGTMCHTLGG
jgi:hypothetical protein